MLCILVILTSILISCATPKTQAPSLPTQAILEEAVHQLEPSFLEKMAKQERIKRIADPIIWKNADLCDGILRYGFEHLDTSIAKHLETPYRALYAKYYELEKISGIPTITRVEAFSPAAQAGLQIGDQIEKVNGKDVQPERELDVYVFGQEKAIKKGNFSDLLSYSRDNYFNKKNIHTSPKVFTVRRGEDIVEIPITPQKSCAESVLFVESRQVNAFADGQNIFITDGMLSFASDDELALVIAHELAHCVEKHIESKTTNALIAGLLVGAIAERIGRSATYWGLRGAQTGAKAFSQEFEREADYVGMYLLARAGYSTAGVEAFWRRMAERGPEKANNFKGTHPPTAYRYILLSLTHAEIEKKKAAGLPLLPNRKTGK